MRTPSRGLVLFSPRFFRSFFPTQSRGRIVAMTGGDRWRTEGAQLPLLNAVSARRGVTGFSRIPKRGLGRAVPLACRTGGSVGREQCTAYTQTATRIVAITPHRRRTLRFAGLHTGDASARTTVIHPPCRLRKVAEWTGESARSRNRPPAHRGARTRCSDGGRDWGRRGGRCAEAIRPRDHSVGRRRGGDTGWRNAIGGIRCRPPED